VDEIVGKIMDEIMGEIIQSGLYKCYTYIC
jgi:hypothetical protein